MSSLKANKIDVSRRGSKILSDTSFSIDTGELVGLIGPNGAGKTTLLRALTGIQQIEHGTIELDGENVNRIDRIKVAKNVAYLEQSSQSHWPLAVENLVMLGRIPHLEQWQRPSASDWEIVRQAMATCDVLRFANRPITTLSGGEQARAMMARALATEPKILLADEPIAGLDPAHQLDMMDKLLELVAQGAGAVVVMHDLSIAARYCSRLSVLFKGQVFSEGAPDDVLSADVLQHCYGIEAHFGKIDGDLLVIPKRRMENP